MRAAICALLLAGVVLGAAPPGRLTPKQVVAGRQAFALFSHAKAKWKAGKQAEAVASMEKAQREVAAIYGEHHHHSNAILSWLAGWETERGRLKEAAEHRERMWRTMAALRGEGHWKTVDARLALTETLARQKRSPAQRAALDRATGLHNQAWALHVKGDSAKAVHLAQKALENFKEALGEKHLFYADGLNNLATLYQAMGDYAAALPLFKACLKITKKALGEKHPLYATRLNNLAVLHHVMGTHKQALALFRQALKIFKEALGEKHPKYAQSLNNLALLHHEMGDHKAALRRFKTALAIQKEALGEKHPDYALTLNNLGVLYQDMGEYKAALTRHKRVLAIRKEVLGEKHPDYAQSLSSLAFLYMEMGDHKAALPLFQQALEISEVVWGKKHLDCAIILTDLATLYQKMGDHKQALPLWKQALAIFNEVLGEKHPWYAQSLNKLAILYLEMGDYKVALPLTEEATSLITSCLQNSASVQSDRQQFAAAEKLRPWLDTRLSLLDAGSYSHLLAWKGSVLLRQRQRRLFTAFSTNSKTREVALKLQTTTRQIAVLSASSRPAKEQLQRLTEEQERLQSKLSELSADAKAAFMVEALTPKALSGTLPEGAVLVDYLGYRRVGVTYRDGKTNPMVHLVAFVSRKGKPTARIELGPAARVGEAARQWRTLLVRGKPGTTASARVKRRIWSPLEKHLAGAKTVLISPDGPLAALPFAALPGKKPGTYLIEDVALVVVPVPQLIPEMLKPVDKTKRLKPSLLVVGDVNYDRASSAVAKVDVGDRGAPLGVRREWGGLAATFAESAAVRKAFDGLFKGSPVTDLRKRAATKASVRKALSEVRYAHLATHGFFAEESVKSAVGEQKPDAFFGREGVTGWHPLLLSGIVLSGANKEPKESEEDGILTALEVSELELPRLELVVLSACETGLGKSAGGEGLLGLQRAFQVAGARTVIASLWKVDDRATQALMAEFYKEAWNEKSAISKAEALRRAQLALLKGTIAGGKLRGLGKTSEKLPKGEVRLPPLYWAAFVLSGDWR
jgi:CHAT domain-containing protein/Tfp pilus assembly protein PilF